MKKWSKNPRHTLFMHYRNIQVYLSYHLQIIYKGWILFSNSNVFVSNKK